MRNGPGRRNKPYYQFVTNSCDIPPIYNKQALIKCKRIEKTSFVKRDFNEEARKIVELFYSDKKNIKLISSVLCYLFVTIDKKHHNIISNVEKYLEKHSNIKIPLSREIPIAFDNAIDTVLNKMKHSTTTKHWNIQKEFEHVLNILLTECIHHPKNLHIHKSSFKHRYPNILRLLKETIAPLLKKHNVLFKILKALNTTCGDNVMTYFPNIDNTFAIQYFVKLRNIMYDDEECKKAIGYNLYIFLSKKTDKISYFRYFNNLFTKNQADIHKILQCISENPNFTKRLVKKALCKLTSEQYEENIEPLPITKLENFIAKSASETKKIARKCRTMANNAFVVAKMGTSVWTIGKKLESKFPGIAKTLFF